VHALLVLSSLMLVVLGGCTALAALRRTQGWPRRRQMQLAVLAAPVLALGVGLWALHHFSTRTCFLGTPSWDYVSGRALPVGMAVVALGGLALGLVRIATLQFALGRHARLAGSHVQGIADRMAANLRTVKPRVLIVGMRRPVAVTVGTRRPTILLSDWMLSHLDSNELESVLAHEMGHVARRDVLVTWLATVLRDAFFYLPTSWAVYRQFQYERELVCDELAVKATGRPFALASALGKVWHQNLQGPIVGSAQALAASDEMIERRIHRLLATPQGEASTRHGWVSVLGPGLQSLLGLATLLAANAVVMLTPMGCGPASAIWKV